MPKMSPLLLSTTVYVLLLLLLYHPPTSLALKCIQCVGSRCQQNTEPTECTDPNAKYCVTIGSYGLVNRICATEKEVANYTDDMKQLTQWCREDGCNVVYVTQPPSARSGEEAPLVPAEASTFPVQSSPANQAPPLPGEVESLPPAKVSGEPAAKQAPPIPPDVKPQLPHAEIPLPPEEVPELHSLGEMKPEEELAAKREEEEEEEEDSSDGDDDDDYDPMASFADAEEDSSSSDASSSAAVEDESDDVSSSSSEGDEKSDAPITSPDSEKTSPDIQYVAPAPGSTASPPGGGQRRGDRNRDRYGRGRRSSSSPHALRNDYRVTVLALVVYFVCRILV